MFLHCSGTAIFFHQDLNFCLLMLGSIWVLTWISFVWSSDWGTSLCVSALATVLRITSTTCTWIHTDTTVFILLFFHSSICSKLFMAVALTSKVPHEWRVNKKDWWRVAEQRHSDRCTVPYSFDPGSVGRAGSPSLWNYQDCQLTWRRFSLLSMSIGQHNMHNVLPSPWLLPIK